MQFLTPRSSGALGKMAARAWAISLLVGAFATCSLTAVAQVCPFDNGNSTLANEGLVMTRYALGLRGSAMVASTTFTAADAPTVEANIACPSCGLNITDARDGSNNPTFTPADATIISRKIAGFKGAELTNGLNLGTGSRNTPAAVQSFLLAGCGVGSLPTCLTGQVLTFGSNGALQCGNTAPTITAADPTSGAGANATGRFPSIALSADGFPIIAYLDGASLGMKVMKCTNANCIGGTTITLVDPGVSSREPSITVPADGLPIISYTAAGVDDLKVLKCGNTACSLGNTVTTLDSVFSVGRFSSIAAAADGLPIISYWDSSNGRLKIAKCGNATCTTATLTTADTTPSQGAHTSLVIPADGRPVVSYNDYGVGALKVLKCGNAACTSGNVSSVVDASFGLEIASSIAIASDGLPIISYGNFGGTGLKVVKCGNAACSSGNTFTLVDSTSGVGFPSSMVVPTDGRPVIAYRDINQNDVRAVKCGNAACTSGNQLSVVDSADFVGFDLAMTVPADGRPVIAYFDATNNRLKIAKCSNAGCLSP